MGFVQQKTTPRLFNANLTHYADAVAWVKRYASDHGYVITRATLDPYVEMWFFYERDGAFVLALDHDTLEQIQEVLYAWNRKDHARVQTRHAALRVEARPGRDESEASDRHRDVGGGEKPESD